MAGGVFLRLQIIRYQEDKIEAINKFSMLVKKFYYL